MSVQTAESALRRDWLKRSFSCVPLGLKLLGGPIHPRSPSIFQMDIQQSRNREVAASVDKRLWWID
jgi:hypothetical protein